MGMRDTWERMLVYFGIVDEDDAAAAGRGSTATVRRSDEAEHGRAERPARARSRPARTRSGPAASSEAGHGVGVVPPRTFNDAQRIADTFKRGLPVIVNLQQTDAELSKRLIDFASGLTYGLDGGMQRIADRVFLLTPADVEVTAEERAALIEGGFFNQS